MFPPKRTVITPSSASSQEEPTKASKVISDLLEQYTASTMTQYLQFLIYGPSGSGKTYSLRTARKPLFVNSFDPGGSIALADLVEKGEAIVVTAYEKEDAEKPTAFAKWDSDFDRFESSGIFSQVGTYVIDSATTWGQAALNEVMKRAKRAGGVPQQNDWYPQMVLMEAALRRIMSLPCDVVFICHDDILKDEILGRVIRSPMLTGKAKKRIPLLFSEIYYADVRRSSKGTEYIWQISKDSTNEARSRLRAGAVEQVGDLEPQDFQALMKKFGHSYEDLPPFVS